MRGQRRSHSPRCAACLARLCVADESVPVFAHARPHLMTTPGRGARRAATDGGGAAAETVRVCPWRRLSLRLRLVSAPLALTRWMPCSAHRSAKQTVKTRVAVAAARQQQRQAQQPGPGETRRAGRAAAAPETAAHVLEPLSEDVLAAFAEQQRCGRAPCFSARPPAASLLLELTLATHHRRHKVAGAGAGGAAAGAAPGGKKRRTQLPGKTKSARKAAGTTIRCVPPCLHALAVRMRDGDSHPRSWCMVQGE